MYAILCNTGQYKTLSDCGLAIKTIKHGLGIKRRLRTADWV